MNYKINKIGLLNFWYFDEEEFPFSDGKILLRGENGSGKSVTMQSFIPLILDGNKSPSRLDPFGSKEKRIEDYLLGPSDGTQKDDAIGYLYMEAYCEETKKYITIGMGLRARKGQGTDFWGFALKDGRRIGVDFSLYKEYGQKVLLTKKELRARLGNDNEYAETAKDYKRFVNDLLFGFHDLDSYDEFINVLLQLRSSKLSKEYTPTKLMGILSSVLQPLTDDDIRPLSEAIEDTNKTKEKVETLEKQVKSLSYLLKSYQNYNEIILFNKADAVSTKRREVKQKKKDLEDKTTKVAELKERVTFIRERIETLEKEYVENTIKLDTIDNKDLKKYTEELVTINEEIEKTSETVENIKKKLENFLKREEELKEQIAFCDDEIYKNEKEIFGICSDVSMLCEEIGTQEFKLSTTKITEENEFDYNSMLSRVSKYKVKLNRVKVKLEEKEKLEGNINQLEEEHLRIQKELDKKTEEQKLALKSFNEKIDKFQDELRLLDEKNKIIKLEQDMKKDIFELVRNYSYENYTKSKDIYLSVAHSFEREILEEENSIKNKIKLETEKLQDLTNELENLKNREELELEENEETEELLNSKNIPYLSFYKAIEFKDNISEDDKNKLEDLFASMNLLVAKIVPKKHIKAIEEIPGVFLKPGTKKKNNLLKYFIPVENELVTKQEIIEILESISIDKNEEIHILPNEFKLDFLVGFSSKKYESKYIGILKRKQQHQEQVKLKEKEVSNQESIIINYQNLLTSAHKKYDTVQEEMRFFPSNQDLEVIRKNLTEIEIIIKSISDNNQELVGRITKITKEIENIMTELNTIKENIPLPLNLASYKEAIELVEEVKSNIQNLQIVYKSLQTNKEKKESYASILQDTENDLSYQNDELHEKNKNYEELVSRRKSINEVLDNPDNKKLIKQLEELTERQKKIPEEKESYIREDGSLNATIDNLEEAVMTLTQQLLVDTIELELKELLLDKEYKLNYVFKEENYTTDMILTSLKDRKNSDIKRAFENYIQSFNDYRLELLEYRLNTKEDTSVNQEIIDTYINKGLDEQSTKMIVESAIRHDMSAIYQGKLVNIYNLEECLKEAIIESESYINAQERHLFEDILLKTVGNKIRDRIESSKDWVSKMNKIMQDTQNNSNLSFQLEWKSKSSYTEDELDTKEIVRLLKIDAGQLAKSDSEKLVNHFRSQIKKELEYSEKTHESYSDIIGKVLDYRNWFEFKLYYSRKQGEKKELTNKVFFVLSGGERAKSMYVPLFAAVYAKLLTAKENSLRLIALDEAFAGVDNSNVREMFAILSYLNLDYILTSQALWGDYDSISSISICELIKDEINKAVGVRHYLWNGHTLKLVEGNSLNG